MKHPLPKNTLSATRARVIDTARALLSDDDFATIDQSENPIDDAINALIDLLEKNTAPKEKKPRRPRKFGDKISADVASIIDENTRIFTDCELSADWCVENDTRGYQMTAIGISHLKTLGHNAQSIRRFLTENADMIATHHTDMGINTESHNRIKGKLNRRTDD